MKTTKIKATQIKYWIDTGELKRGNGGIVTPNKMFDDVPVYLLPADADSYERMVEKMAFALGRRKWFNAFPARKEFADEVGNKGLNVWVDEVQAELRAQARTALRAIGITAPKKGTKC